MIVLDDGDTEDKSKTGELEEEDTVPAGTDVLVESEVNGTMLDPPATPPPMLLEVVRAGVTLEVLGDFKAEDAGTGDDEGGGADAGVEVPAG